MKSLTAFFIILIAMSKMNAQEYRMSFDDYRKAVYDGGWIKSLFYMLSGDDTVATEINNRVFGDNQVTSNSIYSTKEGTTVRESTISFLGDERKVIESYMFQNDTEPASISKSYLSFDEFYTSSEFYHLIEDIELQSGHEEFHASATIDTTYHYTWESDRMVLQRRTTHDHSRAGVIIEIRDYLDEGQRYKLDRYFENGLEVSRDVFRQENGKWLSDYTSEYTYTGDGKELTSTAYVSGVNNTELLQRTENEFDNEGNRVSTTLSINRDGQWETRVSILYFYETPLSEKVDLDFPLVVYPNPAIDFAIIRGVRPGVKNVKLVDQSGRIFERQLTNTGNDRSLDVSNLPTGAYLIHLENKTLRFIKK